MMRVSHVTISKTRSWRQHGVVELWTSNVEDFLILYLSLIVAFYLLFLDN